MGLRIYNSMTRTKEPFEPRYNTVKMYVCGPTVYDYSHLGHAKSYVSFDVVRRYLEFKGFDVRFVENFTDIAEEISKKALKLGVDATEVAEKFEKEYLKDMDALRIERANEYPRVSECIQYMIDTIKDLQEEGLAYEIDGEVYFDTSKSEDYGSLSRLSVDELSQSVEYETKRKSLIDFALWKKSKDFEKEWDSPWGKGRPGWHIECYVMASKHLGLPLDIQAGGLDLVFPHHESARIMALSKDKKDFSRFYMHNGFFTIGGKKMSKSTGVFVPLRPLIQRYGGEAVRFYIMKTHYRANLAYDDADLEGSAHELQKLYETVDRLDASIKKGESLTSEFNGSGTKKVEDFNERFLDSMDDDFDTPSAIQTMLEMTEWAADNVSNPQIAKEVLSNLESFLSVLGLSQFSSAR
jgi:cysteinyl-tRNA synthetase